MSLPITALYHIDTMAQFPSMLEFHDAIFKNIKKKTIIRSLEKHEYIREPMYYQVLITLLMRKGILELVDKNALRTVNPADFSSNAFTRRHMNYSFE